MHSCIAFVDYENAFDSMQTHAVLNSLQEQGIDGCIELLKVIYTNSLMTGHLHKESNKIILPPKVFTAGITVSTVGHPCCMAAVSRQHTDSMCAEIGTQCPHKHHATFILTSSSLIFKPNVTVRPHKMANLTHRCWTSCTSARTLGETRIAQAFHVCQPYHFVIVHLS